MARVLGIVHLRGTINGFGAVDKEPVLTLPVGYRPSARSIILPTAAAISASWRSKKTAKFWRAPKISILDGSVSMASPSRCKDWCLRLQRNAPASFRGRTHRPRQARLMVCSTTFPSRRSLPLAFRQRSKKRMINFIQTQNNPKRQHARGETHCHFATLQSQLAETSVAGCVGCHATSRTVAACPLSVRTSSPVRVSHTITAPHWLPL